MAKKLRLAALALVNVVLASAGTSAHDCSGEGQYCESCCWSYYISDRDYCEATYCYQNCEQRGLPDQTTEYYDCMNAADTNFYGVGGCLDGCFS